MGAKPLRVLMVDDSEAEALPLIRDLRQAGYEPHHDLVDTAPAMLSALQHHPWDLILSGCRFGDFDCLKALALLKETGLDIPFIIVSPEISEEMAIEALKAGAQDCVKNRRPRRLTSFSSTLRSFCP